MKVLAISGSLRRDSYNTAVIRALDELKPANMSFEIADFAALPVYNGDFDGDKTPEVVKVFKERIRTAECLLICSPEYNASIPGGLKNAIDWASRPPVNAFAGKPIAILGASPGVLGTSRMQIELRRVLNNLDALVMNKPDVFIGQVNTKIDAGGKLHDQGTRDFLKGYLAAYATWMQKLGLVAH